MMYPHSSMRGGFLLFEVIVAVSIFALGVLALGKCVQACLAAEIAKEQDSRARLVLSNRMTEIHVGAVALGEPRKEELKGMFAGMTLKTARTPLKEKNEKNVDLTGLYAVTLEVIWQADGGDQSRTLEFYHYPRQQP